MATSIVMPQMGYDMREGTVVRWHKKEGETVARGEVLADIETDKATVEFEAYTGGVVGRIVAAEGMVVPVGELIAIITAPGEAIPDEDLPDDDLPASPPDAAPASSGGRKQPGPPSRPLPLPTQGTADTGTSDEGRLRASPIARRLARERGIDLGDVNGTGPGGRIVEKGRAGIRASRPGRQNPPAGSVHRPSPAAWPGSGASTCQKSMGPVPVDASSRRTCWNTVLPLPSQPRYQKRPPVRMALRRPLQPRPQNA